MADIVARERTRQGQFIELIASENIVSRAVLEAQGSVITNKTVEGYPGARYHGGAEVVDEMERLGIERARRLFDCTYVNLQPHSGSQANQVVLHALLKPGERILSMDLSAGGPPEPTARVSIRLAASIGSRTTRCAVKTDASMVRRWRRSPSARGPG